MSDLTERLATFIRTIYPHQQFPDGAYLRTAQIVLAAASGTDAAEADIPSGLRELDEAAGGDFAALGENERLAIATQLEGTTFFQFVRGQAVVALYDDHEVWQILGYEGASFDQGGYLHRGFADLEWLPEPRVEEYDGPLTLPDIGPRPKEAR